MNKISSGKLGVSRRVFVGGVAAGVLGAKCGDSGDDPVDAAPGDASVSGGSGGGAGGSGGRAGGSGGSGGTAGRDAGPRIDAVPQTDVRASDMPVIDTHIHLWDLSKSPPFSNGQNALPADYVEQATPAGITGCVLVEANWNSLGHNQWGLEQAANNKVIVGVIGALPIYVTSFPANFMMLAQDPLFRGLRIGDGSQLMQANTQAGLKMLADAGLVADVNANGTGAVMTVATNAAMHPMLKIVLDHAGYLPFNAAPSQAWMSAMAAAAANQNVFCKVSRFQEQAGGNTAPMDPAVYTAALEFLWQTFGENRLIFGSNWPLSVDKGGTLYDAVLITKAFFMGKGSAAAQKFFSGNAKTTYGVKDR